MIELKPCSVKICSLREVEHAQFVLDAGADLFGLIFAAGRRRQVTPERAREIVRAVRVGSAGRPPLAVGVFVDLPAAEINAIVRAADLDLVQLHGSEPPELLAELDVPAIKALSSQPSDSLAAIESTLRSFATARQPPIAYLIDGQHGGTGTRADWALAGEIARGWPVMLAGGLTPGNVSEAISTVGPLAVDVSSGVETDGYKDAAKIAAFAANARMAFGASARIRSREGS